jgi:hypothetical protein
MATSNIPVRPVLSKTGRSMSPPCPIEFAISSIDTLRAPERTRPAALGGNDSIPPNSGSKASRNCWLSPWQLSRFICSVPHFRSRSPYDFVNPRAAFTSAGRVLTSAARARIRGSSRQVYGLGGSDSGLSIDNRRATWVNSFAHLFPVPSSGCTRSYSAGLRISGSGTDASEKGAAQSFRRCRACWTGKHRYCRKRDNAECATKP